MKIGFVDATGVRPVRLTRMLPAGERLRPDGADPCRSLPIPALVNGGLVFGLNGGEPAAGLPALAVAVGEGRHSVEQVIEQRWIGRDLLLARLAMLDLCNGGGFERWFVADVSACCVELLWHDLTPPPHGLFRSIRSNDPDHAWLQYVHVFREGERVGQTEMVDGAILELHRVPVARLLSNYGVRGRLVGALSCVYAPTLFMLTAGERSELEVGDAVLIDDVEIRPEGALSLIVVSRTFDLAARTNAIRDLYELSLSRDGGWSSARLFDSVDDEHVLLF